MRLRHVYGRILWKCGLVYGAVLLCLRLRENTIRLRRRMKQIYAHSSSMSFTVFVSSLSSSISDSSIRSVYASPSLKTSSLWCNEWCSFWRSEIWSTSRVRDHSFNIYQSKAGVVFSCIRFHCCVYQFKSI
jgi:hypothetical protein